MTELSQIPFTLNIMPNEIQLNKLLFFFSKNLPPHQTFWIKYQVKAVQILRQELVRCWLRTLWLLFNNTKVYQVKDGGISTHRWGNGPGLLITLYLFSRIHIWLRSLTQQGFLGLQVFLGFPVSISKCWDGSQHSQLPLHASHIALLT